MKAVVVYESMYGNTHHVATAIGAGLGSRPEIEVEVMPVESADLNLLASADLLVVGGPTHVHSMSRASTRQAAVDAAEKPDSELELDPDAEGPGLREWFSGRDRLRMNAAAFDTRMHGPAAVTGRASKGIAKRLKHHGATLVTEPESFIVTKDNHLEPDEEERATAWGVNLARQVATESTTGA
jgi:menaquinone-dependent protoporphyrinogen IX oxidase